MKWRYGDSWEKFPIEPGEIWGLPDGSRLTVHDIFEPLPEWMRADLLFVDPPWNLGNLNSFYTKAERTDYHTDFADFADMLFHRIDDIGAITAYVEIGNQSVSDWYGRMAEQFHYVQHWPVTYYRKSPTNLLRGSNLASTRADYTGIDEADCIKILAEIEDYQIIADPCMGRGLVGKAAYRMGHPFVGTELNKRRLACLLDALDKLGANIMKVEKQTWQL